MISMTRCFTTYRVDFTLEQQNTMKDGEALAKKLGIEYTSLKDQLRKLGVFVDAWGNHEHSIRVMIVGREDTPAKRANIKGVVEAYISSMEGIIVGNKANEALSWLTGEDKAKPLDWKALC